ncbi:hypothetical protein A0U87_15195 [Sphingobium sp. MP9-4]|uniref:hypothetical protein n=1 Tax=Sphingobium sp. MP9-4 TaxID=1761936 RepID=UPI0010CA7171|nr:hypothetical protein [Sphingobium sp. MP9-4]TKV42965.1 hypothetical protein A0U87_15195 [Sphingobium sp. MP9-4]
MAPGKKLSDPARKKLAGTRKKSVDNNVVSITPDLVRDVPVMPEWLSPGAREVWAADIERIAATGATAVDSSAVALYCETMAVFVASVRAQEPVNAAFRSELRKQAELLGIAGAKSRLARIAAREPAKTSPFSVRAR